MAARVELPNLPALVAVLFGAVPAMILLYVFLNRYDTFFSERRLLMALLVGLLAGSGATLVEILFLRFHEPAFLLGSAWHVGLFQLVIVYPLLETMAKFIPVNWSSYRGKRDTPYYAAGIGVGFAAINAFILIARGVVEFSEFAPQLTHLDIAVLAIGVLLLFVGGVMAQGFTTVVMGQAVADRDPIRAFFYGAALLMPYYAGYWAMARIVDNPLLGFLVIMAIVAYGVAGVVQVRRKILDQVVPPKVARKLRREMRRQAAEGKEEPMEELPKE